jgi:hypothetical protein
VTSFRISYEGPRSFAVRAATLLAEAHGVELTSSEPPAQIQGDSVMLALIVEATAEDVGDALSAIARRLPRHATMRIDET